MLALARDDSSIFTFLSVGLTGVTSCSSRRPVPSDLLATNARESSRELYRVIWMRLDLGVQDQMSFLNVLDNPT